MNLKELLLIIIGAALIGMVLSPIVSAQPIQQNGNIGLPNLVLEVPVIEQSGTEGNSYLDCSALLVGAKEVEVSCEWQEDFWLDATTMNLGQFKDKYSELSNYFPKNNDFVKWVKAIRDDGLKETANGLATTNDLRKAKGQTWTKKVKVNKGKENSFKLGENSLEIYLTDGDVDVWVTPETITSTSFSQDGWVYEHPVELTNNGTTSFFLNENNFSADYIDYELLYDYEYETTEPKKDVCIEKIDLELGKYCEYTYHYKTCTDPYYGEHTCIDLSQEHTYQKKHIIKKPFNELIEVLPKEKLTIYFKFNSFLQKGKWNFHLLYNEQDYLIDPYYYASSTIDLNHNWDLNGFVWQIEEGEYSSAWTPTNIIDWNKDSANDWSEGGTSWESELVGYFKFDSVNGTTITDSADGKTCVMGNGANIEIQGLWDSNAINLDGGNDWCIIPDTTDFTFSNGSNDLPYTISAWIYIDDLTGGSALINKYTSSGTQIEWLLTIGTDGKLLTTQYDTSGGLKWIRRAFNYVILEGSWQHFVFTYDGTGSGTGMQLYINGKEESSGTNSSSGVYVTMRDSSSTPRIGGVQFLTSTGNFFNGRIDELKVYKDKEFSLQEVVADYNTFLDANFVDTNILDSGVESNWTQLKINKDINYNFGNELDENKYYGNNLVALWHLNDDALDSSGNGNDGTWYGSEAYASGLWGTNAGTFDGSTDYITITDDDTLDLTENASIFAWIKVNDNGNIQRITHKNSAYSFNTGTGGGYNGELSIYNYGASAGAGATTDVTDGKWHHVGFTKDSITLTFYVDGTRDGIITNSVATTDFATSAVDLFIGIDEDTTSNPLNGKIEEVAIWDTALTEQEVVDLYRKGVSKLDLNVYSCSDANCATRTSSQYITDMNNNMDVALSVSNSIYLGYDAVFKPITELIDYDAGYFWVNSLISDLNIDYSITAPVISLFNIDFNVLDSFNDAHLTLVDYNCSGLTYSYNNSGVSSPISLDMNTDTYSCEFTSLAGNGYDTNTINVVVDSNKTVIVYLTEFAILDVNWLFPLQDATTSLNQQYFFITASNGGTITDANYSLNDSNWFSLQSLCSNWDTNQVTCNVTNLAMIPNQYNDFNVIGLSGLGQAFYEDNNNYYNPNKQTVIMLEQDGDSGVLIILIFIVVCLLIAGFWFLNKN